MTSSPNDFEEGGPYFLETDRLALRLINAADAAFILRLVNDPCWIRYVGDRGVRSIDDARAYIEGGAVAMHARFGFSSYLVETKTCAPAGISGFFKRESLDDIDFGFAFLPEFRGRGYAFESGSALISYATNTLRLLRLSAVTVEENHSSIRVLEKLDFQFIRTTRIPNDPAELRLYIRELSTPSS